MHMPTFKALQMIGMTERDMRRTAFNRVAGRRAAAVLRSMGYTREKFPTRAGHAKLCWAAPAPEGVYRPEFGSGFHSFDVLVMALACND